MNIEFLSGFEKELAKTRDKKLAKTILSCIQLFEKANNLNEIPNIKKFPGIQQLIVTVRENTV
jgi:mRNA interferase RelE/StbE